MERDYAVVGAGAWGTALANVLANAGGSVKLWSFEPEVAKEINSGHENRTYLPGHPLDPSIIASSNLEEVLTGAKLIVSVSPAQLVGRVMSGGASHISPEAVIVSASKGIELGTGKLMHEVLAKALPNHPPSLIGALSGPSFAAETAKGLPTAVSLGVPDHEAALFAQEALSCSYFRVYTHEDVVGLEVGGAMKNIIALAAGISDGLGFGHNSRAALITRGLAEMGRLGVKLGAKPMTFLGLSGLGDLTLTCTGELSRNRSVGLRLGKGEKLDAILASMTAVAEGVKTCEAAVELAAKMECEMPISEKVREVLFEGKDPKVGVAELMGRPTKREFWDLEECSP